MTDDENKSRRPLNEIHDLRQDMIDATDAFLAFKYDFGNFLDGRVDVDTQKEARKLMHYTVIRYFRRIKPHLKKRDSLWEEMPLWGEKNGLQLLDEWVLKEESVTSSGTDNNLKTQQAVTSQVKTLSPEKIIEASDKLLEASEKLSIDFETKEPVKETNITKDLIDEVKEWQKQKQSLS